MILEKMSTCNYHCPITTTKAQAQQNQYHIENNVGNSLVNPILKDLVDVKAKPEKQTNEISEKSPLKQDLERRRLRPLRET